MGVYLAHCGPAVEAPLYGFDRLHSWDWRDRPVPMRAVAFQGVRGGRQRDADAGDSVCRTLRILLFDEPSAPSQPWRKSLGGGFGLGWGGSLKTNKQTHQTLASVWTNTKDEKELMLIDHS